MRERELFIKALEAESPSARAAVLDESCQGDAERRARVERLLAEHERQESFFLDSPPEGFAPTIDQPLSERPGTVIGPYKLLQQIGEGGMGVVFMAEQSVPIQRTVALKIIKPGMDTRQVIARFEAERQALAIMDHPNIAKVLDAGSTDTGRPYFVMELVKGIPITRYCDDHHLPLRARLELFVEVCQAVQHAHQKGIIHRDIKPTNVLVAEYDNHAVPKVIDFGVAKAMSQKLTDRTMFTEFGQMVGTMEYMSPEQAKLNQLDIDTRSDIYSLGVLLYELLTGSTPFEGQRLHDAAFDEMLRIIREEEPPKPSTRLSTTDQLPSIAANRDLEPKKLSGLVRGELDWVAMKALEKDRNRRYETATGFAADIQRYLNDEAVQACPPSTGYRMRKFARRNKRLVITTSLISFALIAGVTGTTIGLIRAEEARRTAVAREADMQAIFDFVENRVFAAAGPEREDGGLGRDVTLRQAIESALPYVESSFHNQPRMEAKLRKTLGNAFLNLGEPSEAAEQFQKARELLSRYLGSEHRETLQAMQCLSYAYDDLGQYNDALILAEQILKIRKTKFGLDHVHTLSGMSNVAGLYFQLGRYDDALALSEETLPLIKAVLGPDHPDTLAVMCSLAIDYSAVGRDADALKLREATLSLTKAKMGADSTYTFAAMNNLANSHERLGRHADALQLREELLAMRKAKLGPDHPKTLSSMENLASSYNELGRSDDAAKLLKEVLPLINAKLGPEHPETLGVMSGIARTYALQGQHAESLKLFKEALAISQAKRGADHPESLLLMWSTAAKLVKLDRSAEAAPIIDDCLRRTNGRSVRPGLVKGMIMLRVRYFQKINDSEECRATAELYEKLPPTERSELYDAACLRAIVADVIKRDSQVPGADLIRLAKEEADRAMAWLTKSVEAGYRDVPHMQRDTDLDSLRDREDYQQLVAGLGDLTGSL